MRSLTVLMGLNNKMAKTLADVSDPPMTPGPSANMAGADRGPIQGR